MVVSFSLFYNYLLYTGDIFVCTNFVKFGLAKLAKQIGK